MKYAIPVDAVCCVCGKPNPTDYIQITDKAIAFVHRSCYRAECPGKITIKVREAAKID